DLAERRQQLFLGMRAERRRLVAEDDRPVGVTRRHGLYCRSIVRCRIDLLDRRSALQTLQFLDECSPLQVQEAGRLYLVALLPLERSFDQRQLDAFDVPLQVDSLVGEPRRTAFGAGRQVLNLGTEILHVDLRAALAEGAGARAHSPP